MAWVRLRDNEKLFVRTIGRGRPMVLLHGFGSNSLHWLPNVLPLRRRFRFILPDMRGFGRSHHLPIDETRTFEQYADDLADVLQHFHLSHTALGGISTGAYTCLVYNKKYGFDRISKYLHIEHSAYSLNHADRPHGIFGEKQQQVFDEFDRLLAMASNAGIDTPYWELPQEVRDEMRWSMTRLIGRAMHNRLIQRVVYSASPYSEKAFAGRIFPVHNWYAYLQIMQAFMRGNDTEPALSRIKIPMTIMIGMQSRFFTPQAQMAIRRHVPHAKVVQFRKSGHFVVADEPLKFQREFTRFLRT